jgi:ribA/ribD-fused uncharacterized protein
MSTESEEKEIVEKLTIRMRKKLRKNSHKLHWDKLPVPDLLRGLKEEVRELEEAIEKGEHPEAIANEAADISNFAAMIAAKFLPKEPVVQLDGAWWFYDEEFERRGPFEEKVDAQRGLMVYDHCVRLGQPIESFGKIPSHLFRFLSNFWPVQVDFEGILYPSVEHAYQAAKTLDPGEREHVRGAPSPGSAKQRGRKVTIRPDWDDKRRLSVMQGLLAQKFLTEPMRTWLLLTGDVQIAEGNTWGDTFWGVLPNGTGNNHLGKMLMRIRADLRNS